MMALAVAGGLLAGVGSFINLQSQAQAAEYSAKVNEINAQTARLQAGADVARKQREKVRALGTMRANYGASGLQVAGSALDVMTDSFLEYTLDEKTIAYQGEINAIDFQNKAKLGRMEARANRVAAPIALAQGAVEGVGTALRVRAALPTGNDRGY